ncbi:hypothetical protein QN277_010493 [Acacia crassicarpa]|uniref:Transposase-associated domain-containing protein n=1 Tax=Acacia crassicarpa TaxID=499986 RepID=A0AAE1IQZ1_9FABA|nr:hypothetical protein QN277_010493 [Acacia crassicarpa]
MDHSWMNALRTSDEYENGVDEFIAFAKTNVPSKDGKYFCPCVNCANASRRDVDDIKDHLICDGINLRYKTWIWHGEEVSAPMSHSEKVLDIVDDDGMKKMIHDVEVESFAQSTNKLSKKQGEGNTKERAAVKASSTSGKSIMLSEVQRGQS